MKPYIVVYFGLLLAASFFSSCNNNSKTATRQEVAENRKVPVDASIFQTDKGWGYSILVDNKLYIQQDIIPAITGNQGFATKDDATKVAKLVLKKMAADEKPIVTKEDLKQLGIIQ